MVSGKKTWETHHGASTQDDEEQVPLDLEAELGVEFAKDDDEEDGHHGMHAEV